MIISRSALHICWQLYVCPDYKLPPEEDPHGKLLQILSVVFQRMQFGSDIERNVFLIAEYFRVKVLIKIQLLNRYIKIICCVDT